MSIKSSLIIPAWNAENTIYDCLLSAIKANKPPDEIIVVDDNSNDKTRIIVDNIIKNYPQVKIFSLKKNIGPAAARDYGVNKSNGNLIFFTDSDTTILANTFLNSLNTLIKYNADAISGIYHPEPINKGNTQLYKALFFYFQFSKYNKPFSYETFNGQIALITKDVYLKVGGYNSEITWGMDNENEELGRRIIKKHKLLLDPTFQVKHNFPGFNKLTKTYFYRVSSWMLVFMEDMKFESGGPAALDSGLAALSVPIFLLFLTIGLIFNSIFIILFFIFLIIWLNGYIKFFRYVLTNKPKFLVQSILLNLWFSSIISFGAIWGLLRWIIGHRVIKS